ncbi:hypothetical protein [Paenibacillus abyssi]|nr:hypothetical protein [Paenibacillus abyssi]
MKQHIKHGWRLAIKHFYIVILLFLYQLLWGFFLYRFVESVVVPLLKRYPDTLPSETAVQLFLMEAQFQIFKTDLIKPYLWILGGLFAARMLITPLINAGLFYSLHHTKDNGGTHFFLGIRRVWKPVLLLYWLETALLLAPAWWLLPRAFQMLLGTSSLTQLAAEILPFAAGWLAWCGLIHLLFLTMQFGAVAQTSIFGSLWRSLRHFLPFVGVSLMMWAIGAGLGLAVSSISLVWAGLLALILHQSYHLVRTLVKVWTVASQYDVWQSRQT